MVDTNFDVPPPGHFIKEELEARNWTQRDLAFILGVQDPEVNVIISGKRGISPDMAKALAKAFDVPAEFFVNLQRVYDLSRARHTIACWLRPGTIQAGGEEAARAAEGLESGMLEFSEVIAARLHVHCYLDGYYVARLSEHDGCWRVQIENKPQGEVRTREEAEEVVRMWVARYG